MRGEPGQHARGDGTASAWACLRLLPRPAPAPGRASSPNGSLRGLHRRCEGRIAAGARSPRWIEARRRCPPGERGRDVDVALDVFQKAQDRRRQQGRRRDLADPRRRQQPFRLLVRLGGFGHARGFPGIERQALYQSARIEYRLGDRDAPAVAPVALDVNQMAASVVYRANLQTLRTERSMTGSLLDVLA